MRPHPLTRLVMTGQLVVQPLSIKEFVRRLKTEKGFSFARYGDGTFLSLLGAEGWNCDGARVSIMQAAEIEASIRDNTIVHGMGDLAVEVGAGRWLQENNIDIEWFDCNVMNNASHLGQLRIFVDWLRTRKIVFLGPSHLRRLKGFPVAAFVDVHPTDAFDEIESLQLIAEYVVGREVADTVLISAGPAAPPLVSRIHRNLPYLNVIDTGSIWDLYVGVLSRKIHRKMPKNHIRDLGIRNFGQEIRSWWTT